MCGVWWVWCVGGWGVGVDVWGVVCVGGWGVVCGGVVCVRMCMCGGWGLVCVGG